MTIPHLICAGTLCAWITVLPKFDVVKSQRFAMPDEQEFLLQAQLGSPTYGICSNPFLDKEFKTEKFEIRIKILSATSFSYEQDTQIKMKNQDKIFHHTDKNTLIKKT